MSYPQGVIERVKGGDYMDSDFNVALHALLLLDLEGRGLSSGELADDICTAPSRVRKIMSSLGKAGMVESTRGIEGQYVIGRHVGEIPLDEVAAAVGSRFVYATWRSGGQDSRSPVAPYMATVIDELYDELDTLCRGHLHEMTVQDVERRILGLSSHHPSGAFDKASDTTKG